MLSTNSTATPITGAAALVTGGHRGFGRAMVEELLDRGAAKVYATGRSPRTPRDERIVPLVIDVTDDNSVAAAARAARDVSIVINNAGINLNTPVLDAPLADIRAELETNLFGTIRVARAFSPVLARHPRTVKSQLSQNLTNLYQQLAAPPQNPSAESRFGRRGARSRTTKRREPAGQMAHPS